MDKIKISHIDYNYIINTLTPAVSSDGTRPALQYIKIDVTNDRISASSVNGYIGTHIVFPCKSEAEFSTYILPVKLPKTAMWVEIEPSQLTVQCSDYDRTFRFKTMNDKFPDVPQLIPEGDVDLTIAVDPAYLIQILKGHANANRRQVKLSFQRDADGIATSKPFCVMSEFDEIKVRSIVLPLRIVR